MMLLCASCSAPRQTSINQYIDSDLSSLDDTAYKAAVKSISAATKIEYPVLTDKKADRNSGPSKVLGLGDGALVVGSLRGALQVTYVNSAGSRVWDSVLPLGKYQVGKAISLTTQSDLGIQVLNVPVDMEACQKLIFAVSPKGCVLIRAERANGVYAGKEFSEQLPIFKHAATKLESSTGADSLSALMRLSSPSAVTERSVAAVRSQLEAFATSTNAWIAEAAAAVLILPTR